MASSFLLLFRFWPSCHKKLTLDRFSVWAKRDGNRVTYIIAVLCISIKRRIFHKQNNLHSFFPFTLFSILSCIPPQRHALYNCISYTAFNGAQLIGQIWLHEDDFCTNPSSAPQKETKSTGLPINLASKDWLENSKPSGAIRARRFWPKLRPLDLPTASFRMLHSSFFCESASKNPFFLPALYAKTTATMAAVIKIKRYCHYPKIVSV